MLRFIVKNDEGYKALQRRVENGIVYLEGKWFDPKYGKIVEGYEAMANALLDWEMKTGEFERRFDRWRLEYGSESGSQ